MRKPFGAACFIYWGNNSISRCLQTKQSFPALHPGEMYSKQTENLNGFVFSLVVYLIFQHKSSKFTWLTIPFTEHNKHCADLFFLFLPCSLVQNTIMPTQHNSGGFGSRKQCFSSKEITPLYVKQFPLVDILCTVSQKYLKYSSILDLCN